MSESNDSRGATPFFLGFLLGMFVCLGGGGTFLWLQQRQARARADLAYLEAVTRATALRLQETETQREANERDAKFLRNLLEGELLPMPREKGVLPSPDGAGRHASREGQGFISGPVER